MSQWSEHDIDVNGITLHCHRTGGEHLPLLVLAHGFSDNGLCFQRVGEALEADFDLVMFDARNHGRSSRAEASAEAMVEDLWCLLEALKSDAKPFLLGHSMGGSTVSGVLAKYPNAAAKAVLEDPPWTLAGETEKTESERTADGEKMATGFKRYLDKLNSLSDAQLLAFAQNEYPDWHADDLPAWVDSKRQIDEGAMAGLRLEGWRQTATAIQTPTLLVHSDGKRDGLVTPALATELVKSNPNLTAAQINGAGHNTRRENFDDYIKAVRGFLLG